MTPADPALLARLHAQAFAAPWSEAEFADLLGQAGVFAVVEPDGFILVRVVLDEAEILTLAVAPEGRRQGQARALMQAAIVQALARQAETLFLEVAADNAAALALYEGLGFEMAGRRKGYYDRGAASPRIDALVMRLCLNR